MRLKKYSNLLYINKNRCKLHVNVYDWLPSKDLRGFYIENFTCSLQQKYLRLLYIETVTWSLHQNIYEGFTSKSLRVLYNESIYVCFTSKPLRGVYHEILRLVYDEKVSCALRGIYFIVNVTSYLRRNLRYDGRFTTKRLSRLIRCNTPFTTNLQHILPSWKICFLVVWYWLRSCMICISVEMNYLIWSESSYMNT